jgi:hypothetical protein
VEREAIDRAEGQSGARLFDELAACQGVRPVTDFDALLGHPSIEDETVEEFAAMLREWRREGASPAPRR